VACERAAPGPGGPPAARASGAVAEGLVPLDAAAPRPYFHDFGERLWGERIEHVFRLANREGRAIVVQDLLPDCGCTQPRATRVAADGTRSEAPPRTRGLQLAIGPGEMLEVAIALDTTRVERPNQHKLAQVRLRCDSEVTPYQTFELHVLVKRAFRAVPSELVLSDVPQHAGKSARADLSVEIVGDRSRLRGVEQVEGPFQAALEARELERETLWVLTVTADPGLPLGPHQGAVTLATTGPDGESAGAPLRVPVRAQVVTDCVVEPRVLTLPAPGDAPLAAELVALAPGARVLVRAARLTGPGAESFTLQVEPLEPDSAGRAARWRLALERLADATAPTGALLLTLELDHELLPRLEVPLAPPRR
jgi:hypothetical protein